MTSAIPVQIPRGPKINLHVRTEEDPKDPSGCVIRLSWDGEQRAEREEEEPSDQSEEQESLEPEQEPEEVQVTTRPRGFPAGGGPPRARGRMMPRIGGKPRPRPRPVPPTTRTEIEGGGAKTLKEVFHNIPLQQIAMDNFLRKRLVLVSDSVALEKAFARLNLHNILSVPVVNDNQDVVGLIDALDLCRGVSDAYDAGFTNANQLRINMLQQPVEQVRKKQHRPTYVISQDATMLDGLHLLSKENMQRVLVADRLFPEGKKYEELTEPEDMIVSLLSQSDYLRFLAENIPWVKKESIFKKTVGELYFGNREPVTIHTDSSAFDGFIKIHKSHRDGLAMVDSNGKLVANLSASNLKGLTRRNINLLNTRLEEFLLRDRRRGWWSLPVCLDKNDTLEKTILQFAATKVHRMYFVDDDGRPTGEVNLTDILQTIAHAFSSESKG